MQLSESLGTDRALIGRLRTLGLASVTMEGDGNCQFRALADQLFAEYGVAEGQAFNDSAGFSGKKEHHFFDEKMHYRRGFGAYARTFAPCGVNVTTVDATPAYAHTEATASRFVRTLGPERVVVKRCVPREQTCLARFQQAMGADDTLPLLVYCVVKASPTVILSKS